MIGDRGVRLIGALALQLDRDRRVQQLQRLLIRAGQPVHARPRCGRAALPASTTADLGLLPRGADELLSQSLTAPVEQLVTLPEGKIELAPATRFSWPE